MQQVNISNSHRLVQSEAELLDLILTEVTNAPHPDLVIMAGHFMLFLDEDRGCLVPGVIEENTAPMREKIERR
ncbi:hypothetical protein LWT37_23765, partial [Enterobacter hormaechei]|nr:hypothetical protein [Enterobacter hormaechei]MCE1737095.1 hypothetical protein [Enterobacter hormaechei]